jgi:broad specificity phosphatase PhoE
MTIFYLVRHALHVRGDDILVGRSGNVPLSDMGRRQAEGLASRWRSGGIHLVQSSPRLRARQTAQPIARACGLPIEITPAIDEVDFGDWTGRCFSDLDQDEEWRTWNNARSVARAPGGETIEQVRARLMAHLAMLAERWGDKSVLLVTHAEIVRTAILHALGRPLDDFAVFDVPQASVSTFFWTENGLRWLGFEGSAAA